MLRVFLVLLISVALYPATVRSNERMLVFVAASMKEAIETAATRFEPLCNCKIVLAVAATSILARQIEAGAPANLFIAADTAWVNWLEEKGRVKPARATVIASNQLVIATSERMAAAPGFEILRKGRFAMGDPSGVPAGKYAKAALENSGLWEAVKANALYAENVRVSLSMVADGVLPAGIVYRSDLLVEPKVILHHAIDPVLHPTIAYIAVPVGEPDHRVSEFAKFLLSEDGQAVLVEYGFRAANEGVAAD